MNSDKKYTVVLLIVTLISVGIMIYFNDIQNYLEYNYFTVNEDSSFINNDNLNLEEKVNDDSVQDIRNEINNTLLKEENIIEKSLDNSIDEKYEEKLEDVVEEKNNTYINDNNGNISTLEEEKSITVFKVDKNNIVSKIPNKDKLKLLGMANSLSVNDYKELLTHVKRSDELLAAVDIFKLLKEKLSVRDYEKLTEKFLTYSYLDLDAKTNNFYNYEQPNYVYAIYVIAFIFCMCIISINIFKRKEF